MEWFQLVAIRGDGHVKGPIFGGLVSSFHQLEERNAKRTKEISSYKLASKN